MPEEQNTSQKPLLPIPPSAKKIHGEIIGILRGILDADYPDCDNEEFRRSYARAMELYDDYQRESVAASGDSLACREGCWICCCHYPEDVYSFEAELIAHYVRKMPAKKRARIEESCEAAVYRFERLRNILREKLSLDEYKSLPEESDPDEILLNSYYRLRNRCPFLDESDRCMIYRIRPLTCRAYINLGDPSVCPPEMINEADVVTYILDLDDEANELLDTLHFRYEQYPRDTALCSLVLKYLSEDA
ncbi:MAG TPA: YkgJ family cysteine cluster protein [Spirochaetota bacterium]|nr:YkgJ family cysteine cluster protein [Spirochaetota bacterium]